MITARYLTGIRHGNNIEKARWHQFRTFYPHLSVCLLFLLATLLLVDLYLIHLRNQLHAQEASLRLSLSQTERLRGEAAVLTERHLSVMTAEQARRATLVTRESHLALDGARGVLYLRREGALLREMPVLLGRRALPAGARDPVFPGLAPGKWSVVAVLDGSHPEEFPAGVFEVRGLKVPGQAAASGALGPVTLVLDSGALIYSLPGNGLKHQEGYLLPAGVQADAADLEAIKAELRPGMTVYVY